MVHPLHQALSSGRVGAFPRCWRWSWSVVLDGECSDRPGFTAVDDGSGLVITGLQRQLELMVPRRHRTQFDTLAVGDGRGSTVVQQLNAHATGGLGTLINLDDTSRATGIRGVPERQLHRVLPMTGANAG